MYNLFVRLYLRVRGTGIRRVYEFTKCRRQLQSFCDGLFLSISTFQLLREGTSHFQRLPSKILIMMPTALTEGKFLTYEKIAVYTFEKTTWPDEEEGSSFR